LCIVPIQPIPAANTATYTSYANTLTGTTTLTVDTIWFY